jgi:hypothetical protein
MITKIINKTIMNHSIIIIVYFILKISHFHIFYTLKYFNPDFVLSLLLVSFLYF